jgi:ubiquinone biosynthesis protein UbiJ
MPPDRQLEVVREAARHADHIRGILAQKPLARDAAEALAVHEEHRARNLQAARELARAALRLERTRSGTEALEYRLKRLERKIDVQQKTRLRRGSGGQGGGDAARLLD